MVYVATKSLLRRRIAVMSHPQASLLVDCDATQEHIAVPSQDAAAAVAAGGSPFERATFRYTPLLAWVGLLNVWLHSAASKALFCTADLAAGW